MAQAVSDGVMAPNGLGQGVRRGFSGDKIIGGRFLARLEAAAEFDHGFEVVVLGVRAGYFGRRPAPRRALLDPIAPTQIHHAGLFGARPIIGMVALELHQQVAPGGEYNLNRFLKMEGVERVQLPGQAQRSDEPLHSLGLVILAGVLD